MFCVPGIRVPMATIRIIQCPQDFYETIKTGDNNAANTGINDRIQEIRIVIYLDHKLLLNPSPERLSCGKAEGGHSTTTSRNSHQTAEILPSPIPIPRVPGIVDQLEGDDTSCTQRQTPEYPNGMPECTSASMFDAEGTLGIIRQQDEPLLLSVRQMTPALPCRADTTYHQRLQRQDRNTPDKKSLTDSIAPLFAKTNASGPK